MQQTNNLKQLPLRSQLTCTFNFLIALILVTDAIRQAFNKAGPNPVAKLRQAK
jgi:hypothetical protein